MVLSAVRSAENDAADGACGALVRSRMIKAGKRFRRVSGRIHLPSLRPALEREIAQRCRTRHA